MTPTYTFVSKSTAKPGRLDDLIRIANAPPAKMDEVLDGVVAYQVAVDRDRNSVIVWATFDSKETLYDYLATAQGKANHGDEAEMAEIIETFEMFDLEPTVGRLT